MRYARRLLELGGDPELLFFGIVFELKQVRLAANLAVLDVALTTPGGFVDVGHVPLAAAGALEAGFHEEIVARFPDEFAVWLPTAKSRFLASLRDDSL